VHRWVFGTACKLHEVLADEEQIAEFLRRATAGCGREVSEREIQDAVRNSRPDVRDENATTERPWPERDDEMIQRIATSGPKLSDLMALSPLRLSDDKRHADEVVDGLFPGDPLLCVGMSQSRFETRSRSRWRRELETCQFIVPSPMSKVWGLTKQGKRSMHTLENTGPRWYLVTEFDPTRWHELTGEQQAQFGTEESYYLARKDVQAAVLHHLRQYAPLALVVHSGGKSLHGWWPCRNRAEDHLRKFFSLAVKLGADPTSWTKCHFVRVPDGTRDDGARQRVLFFNPSALEVA
jgi:hypothetical protein